MSVLIAVAARDLALQGFANPFFVPTTGVAMRSFRDEVNRKAADNPLSAHPEDYELWQLGMFDSESGVFSNEARVLVRGVDVVEASRG